MYLERNVSVTLPNVVSDYPANHPLVPPGTALVANSLCQVQEKDTMRKPEV